MIHRYIKGFAILFFLGLSTELHAQSDAFVSAMASGKYERAHKELDESISAVVSSAQLKAIMSKQQELLGQLESYAFNCKERNVEGLTIVNYTMRYKDKHLDMQVSLTAEEKVLGFYFVKVKNCGEKYLLPNYQGIFEVVDSVIQTSDGFEFQLCYPKSEEFSNLVILVPGSGPNDAESTIGQTKIFRDISLGLAKKGIASVRYRKFQLLKNPKEITFKDEYLGDINRLILHFRTINKDINIFLLGHSLGGTAITHYNSADVSGLIYMAANYSPVDSLVMQQSKYLMELDGDFDLSEQAQFNDMQTQFALLDSVDLADDFSILGAPVSYWKSLKQINIDSLLLRNKDTPKLFLQGGRDYQVPLSELKRWMIACQDHPEVKFLTFESLNHVFSSGYGASKPEEYQIPSNLGQSIIDEIIGFVQ